jgi:hypothetical protein
VARAANRLNPNSRKGRLAKAALVSGMTNGCRLVKPPPKRSRAARRSRAASARRAPPMRRVGPARGSRWNRLRRAWAGLGAVRKRRIRSTKMITTTPRSNRIELVNDRNLAQPERLGTVIVSRRSVASRQNASFWSRTRRISRKYWRSCCGAKAISSIPPTHWRKRDSALRA